MLTKMGFISNIYGPNLTRNICFSFSQYSTHPLYYKTWLPICGIISMVESLDENRGGWYRSRRLRFRNHKCLQRVGEREYKYALKQFL